MKFARRLGLVLCVVVEACQATRGPGLIVLDGDRSPARIASSPSISTILAQAGVLLTPADRLLLNGRPVTPTDSVDLSGVGMLQVLHAVRITVNGRPTQTAAGTVGEALAEDGQILYAADLLDPPADARIADGTAIRFTPSTPLTVTAEGRAFQVRSAAASVGDALAGVGIPLVGLDASQPASDAPIPADGAIRVTRTAESLVLSQESIPFASVYQDSPQLGLGQEQVSQPGVSGLKVTRIRVRYENDREVSRQSEAPSIVRPAQDRVVTRGTKIVENSSTLNGVSIQYWLEMQMYATVYSPCDSGACSYGTASGLRAGKGVVAVDPSLYAYLNGQRLYIPGYGFAVIGDLGGGYIVEQNLGISRYKWIDLGFDDNNMEDLTGWITVYFLIPAPATIPDVLK